MKAILRRCGLAIGFALLVGGWGMTGYAHEAQQQITEFSTAGKSTPKWYTDRMEQWLTGEFGRSVTTDSSVGQDYSGNLEARSLPSSAVYAYGVVLMAFGAGFVGLSFPKSSDRVEHY